MENQQNDVEEQHERSINHLIIRYGQRYSAELIRSIYLCQRQQIEGIAESRAANGCKLLTGYIPNLAMKETIRILNSTPRNSLEELMADSSV